MSGIDGGNMAGASGPEMVQIPQYLLDDSPILGKKLKEFQEAEQRANEAIALVGVADEIQGLRDQAVVERDAADKASAETKEECAKLISDALDEAEDLVRKAETEANEMISKSETTLGRAQTVESNAQETMRSAQEASRTQISVGEALDRRTQTLEAKEAELEELQTQLLQEKSVLASVSEQIHQALGG